MKSLSVERAMSAERPDDDRQALVRGQLGVFAFLNRPKPPPQSSEATTDGAALSLQISEEPCSVLLTAPSSVGIDGGHSSIETHRNTGAEEETQEYHGKHQRQSLSTLRSEVRLILQEEISRSLSVLRSEIKTTKEDIVAGIVKAGS
jgi:hypothetical protein